MLISSNHFFFFRRLHCVEITRVFKSEKLFVELLTFCHEWEAPGVIVTFFSVVSSKRKKKKKKFQTPTVICVIESRKRRKKRDFVSRSTSGIPTNANLRQSSTTHARVRVHCSTRIAGRRRVRSLCERKSAGDSEGESRHIHPVGTEKVSYRERRKGSQLAQRARYTGLTDFVVCPRERKQTNE